MVQIVSLVPSYSTRQIKNGTTSSPKSWLSLGSPRRSPLWDTHCRNLLCKDRQVSEAVFWKGQHNQQDPSFYFFKGQAHLGSGMEDTVSSIGSHSSDVPKENTQANLTMQCLYSLEALRSWCLHSGVKVSPDSAEIPSFHPWAWRQLQKLLGRASGVPKGDILGILYFFNPWIKFTSTIEHIQIRSIPIFHWNKNKIWFSFYSLNQQIYVKWQCARHHTIHWGCCREQIRFCSHKVHVPERARIYKWN